MPRGPRISYPNAIFHVINRFVDRHPFFRSKSDYINFLKIYFGTAATFSIHTYAYDLMPNHFHIILETPSGEISRFLQRFLTRAVQFLNRRHHRVGHLLQGRTKTLLVEHDDYFSTVMGYVLLNRVRAGLARDIFSDEYNSVREMLSTGASRLSRGKLWEYLFGHTFDDRKRKSELTLCRKWLASLDAQSNQRRFAQGHIGSFLGSHSFRRQILKSTERRGAASHPGHRRKTDRPRTDWTWTEIVTACEETVRENSWCGLWRNAQTAVRHLSWYVAMDGASWTYDHVRLLQGEPGTPPARYTVAASRIRNSSEKHRLAEVVLDRLSRIPKCSKVAE